MHSFGGSARVKPRVNLSGKRKELTKDEILQKAAADRIEREETRRRNSSARRIQRCFQARRARLEAQRPWRDEFDFLYPAINQDYINDRVDGKALNHLLRIYYTFFDLRQDRQRTRQLLKTFGIGRSASFVKKISKPRLVLKCFVRAWQRNQLCDDEAFSDLLLTLHAFSVSHRNVLEEDIYIEAAKELQRGHREGLERPLIHALCVGRQYGDFDTTTWLAKHVLVVELSESSIQQLILHIPVMMLLAQISQVHERKCSADLTDIEILGRSALLINTLKIASRAIQDGNSPGGVITLLTLTKELKGLSQAPPRGDQDTGKLPALQLERAMKELSLFMSRHWRYFIEPQLTPGFLAYAYWVFQICIEARDDLLMHLALFATSPTSPYNLLQSCYDVCVIRNAHDHSVPEWSLQVLEDQQFFLAVLTRVLLTMTDNEFFDSAKNPLSLKVYGDIASGIIPTARWYFNLGLPALSSNYTQPDIRIRLAQQRYTKLLQQIYLRDSRRRFLPRDFWIDTQFLKLEPNVKQVAGRFLTEIADHDQTMDIDSDDEKPDIKVKSSYKYDNTIHNILTNCPFMIPFDFRIEVLQELIDYVTFDDNPFSRANGHHVIVRREHEFEDGFDALWKVGAGIRDHISVDYRDVHGIQEAGIDGGGLTKEFLTSVCKQAFHPDFGLFVETPERLLYPNPSSFARGTSQLQHFEFLGRIIAKCIFQGVLIDVSFAPFFLLNWVGKLGYLDDLQAMDRDLYNGLIALKNYTGDVENDFALDFTLDEEEFGQKRTIKLLPQGETIAVTKQNRLKYIHLVCNYKLNSRLAKQSQAFVKGLSDVLDTRWLSMFSPHEIQALVGGAPVPIDISDLRRNTAYGGFIESDPTVQIFWEVLGEFSNEEKRKLIKFVTSTPRPPLLGFKELKPSFCLRNAGSDTNRLPTASTCVNLLKLPAYIDHETMRRKLRLSITAEAGFDLS